METIIAWKRCLTNIIVNDAHDMRSRREADVLTGSNQFCTSEKNLHRLPLTQIRESSVIYEPFSRGRSECREMTQLLRSSSKSANYFCVAGSYFAKTS